MYTVSFPNIFNKATGKTELSSSTTSINQCLYILLCSTTNELLGDPLYGSSIIDLVYSENNDSLSEVLKNKILYSVDLYEKRIIMRYEDIKILQDNEKVTIYLSYTIKKTGEKSNYSIIINGITDGGIGE